jgi:gluconolactonase
MRVAVVAALALAFAGAATAAPMLLARASYPEGPLFWRGAFHYAEMGVDQVSRLENGKPVRFWGEEGCGPTSLAPYRGGLLVLCHLSAQLVQLNASGAVVARFSQVEGGARLRNPNDSFADEAGGVFFSDPGDFSRQSRPMGFVYRLTPEGRILRVAGPLHYPNGIYFDAQRRTLLVSEHLSRRVLSFDVLRDFTLGSAKTLFEVDKIAKPARTKPYAEAGPDGLEKTPGGDLVVAIYGEGRLLQVTPQGALVREHRVGAPYVTNIGFGPDGGALVVGALVNDAVPFPGAVYRFPKEAFAAQGRP